MIDFAQLHPVWAGFIATFLVSALAVSIGAMIGAVVNSKEGGDAADAAPAVAASPSSHCVSRPFRLPSVSQENAS